MSFNILDKNAGANGWNASATSIPSITGDGEARFSFSASAAGIIIGFNQVANAASSSSYTDIDHALYATENHVQVMENGDAKTLVRSYLDSDVFKLVRRNGIVHYLQNDVVFYTSATASSGEVCLDVSLYAVGDTVNDADLVDGITSISITITLNGPDFTATGQAAWDVTTGIDGPDFVAHGNLTLSSVIDIALDGPDFSASGQISYQPPITITLDGPDFATQNNNILLDGPDFTAAGQMTYESANVSAWVMNVATQEMTRYSPYAFLHIVALDGKFYGVKADGLYLLEGATFGGTTISSSITTKETDFGSNQLKRVPYVYLDSETSTTITPIVEGVSKTSNTSNFGGRRTQLGQGNIGRWWKFKLDKIQRLNGAEFLANIINRKI